MEKLALKIKPPPSPNRDKFPFVGTVNVQGLTIDLENLAGSIREGKGAKGKSWRTKMRYHYGEIRKTKGTDRDKLDVYIGPNPQSKKVFIVHQNHPGGHPKAGQYDEDKIMLGFNSAEEAKRGYLKQYDRKDFFRSITEMPMTQFKKSVFGENKGEKVAGVLGDVAEAFGYGVKPWSEEERARLPMLSPEEQGRAYYTGAGAFQAAGASDDQEELDRQRQVREYAWQADPALREKWTRFMKQNPSWFMPQTKTGEAADPEAAARFLQEYAVDPSAPKEPTEFQRLSPEERVWRIRMSGGGLYDPNETVGQRFARLAQQKKLYEEYKAGKESPEEPPVKTGMCGKDHKNNPHSNKMRRFAKSRKKDKRPSAFIREKMKVGSLREAYELGAKTALAQAGLMPPPLSAPSTARGGAAMSPAPIGGGLSAPSLASGAPPATSSGVSDGTTKQS